MRDKNTSVQVCAKNAGGGGLMREGERIYGTLQYLDNPPHGCLGSYLIYPPLWGVPERAPHLG